MNVALRHQCCSVDLEAAAHAYIPVVRWSPVQLIHRVGCRLTLCNVVYEKMHGRYFVVLSLTLQDARWVMNIRADAMTRLLVQAKAWVQLAGT